MKYYLVKWSESHNLGDRFFHTLREAKEYVDSYEKTKNLKIITLVEEDSSNAKP